MASSVYVTASHRIPAQRATTGAPARVTATDGLLLLMALLWGLNFIVVKYATGVLAPLAFNSARVLLAVVVLWGIVLARRSSMPTRADVTRLLALGVLGNGVYQIFFVEGVSRTRASDAALLLAGAPVIIEIISWSRGLERTGVKGIAGMALSLVGIGFVVSGAAGTPGGSSMTGNLLILSACVCWAVYSVALKPLTERVDGLTLSAVTMTGGLVPLLIAGAPSIAHTAWTSVTPMGWSAVAYSGLIALVLAYLFYYRGVRVLGPTRTSMYSNLQPVFAMAASWLLLGETMKAMRVIGALFILGGIVLTRLPSRREALA